MNSVFLITIILGMAMQGVMRKIYDKKVCGGIYFFNIISALSSLLFFVITSDGINFESKVLIYAFSFAASYCTNLVFYMLAIKWGSLSLATLMLSFSLILPTMYGVIFLDENVGVGFYIGLLFLFISLILITGKSDKMQISFKWIVAAILTFVSNGLCTIIQKMQQLRFDGAYKNEFMIFALVFVIACMFIFSLIKERNRIGYYAKEGCVSAFFSGIFYAVVNLFVMILTGKMNTAIMFPLISAGGIVVTYLISKFGFKEELTKKQLWGLILGICSVILLNI